MTEAREIKDLSVAMEYLSRVRYMDIYVSRIESLIDSKLKEMENEAATAAPYKAPTKTQFDDKIPF